MTIDIEVSNDMAVSQDIMTYLTLWHLMTWSTLTLCHGTWCHDIMASQKINDQCYYVNTCLVITHIIVRVFNGHDDTWPEFLFHHHITRVNTFNFPIDCFTTLVHVLYCWRWRQWGCLSSSVSHDDMIHTADSGRSSTKTETLVQSRNNRIE